MRDLMANVNCGCCLFLHQAVCSAGKEGLTGLEFAGGIPGRSAEPST